jgi:hypothetical protein
MDPLELPSAVFPLQVVTAVVGLQFAFLVLANLSLDLLTNQKTIHIDFKF